MGTVYLAEMSVLPPEVLHEFQEGSVVVKRTDRRFNQVSADQCAEWLDAMVALEEWWPSRYH